MPKLADLDQRHQHKELQAFKRQRGCSIPGLPEDEFQNANAKHHIEKEERGEDQVSWDSWLI